MCDVSIIMINYNSDSYTINCIQSLLEFTSTELSCQYIVVDNGSEKESYYNVKKFIDTLDTTINIELIRSNINTGFGGGK